MRICAFFRDDLSLDDGPAVVVRNLLCEWGKSADVTLVTGSPINPEIQGIKIRFVPTHSMTFRSLWPMNHFLQSNDLWNSDVMFTQPGYAFPLLLLTRIKGNKMPPVFLQVHVNQYLDDYLNHVGLTHRLRSYARQRISMTLANHVITVSRIAQKNLISYYGCAEKLSYINNGVSCSIFTRTNTAKQKCILFVGNIRHHFYSKGTVTLLRAFSLLLKRSRNLTLVIAGKHDHRLKELSLRLGIASNVYSPGPLNQSELVEWYNRATAFVLPSLFDPSPLVVNEAMACGVPVVASDQVGAAESIREADAGLIFRVGDHVALYNCLNRLLADNQLASRLGKNGYDYARRKLDWAVVAQKYLKLFRERVS